MIAKLRVWWNSPPTTWTWIGIAMFIFVFYGLCAIFLTPAHAAVHIDNPTIAIRPETVTSEQKPQQRCMKPRPTIIFLRMPDGRMLLMGIVERLVPC